MTTGATQADLASPRRLRGRPFSALFRFIPGLRGRLLVAFIAISLFVVAAAAAGLYALHEVEQAMDRITLKTVPVALDARELWRKSEKIIGIGPALINASDAEEAGALSGRLRDELEDTSTILARLRATSLDLGPLDEIGDVMTQLNKNLDLMWLAWSDGIAAADQKRRAIGETLAAYRQFGTIWRPRFADLNHQIAQLRRAMTSAAVGPEEQRAAFDQFDQAMVTLSALDQIQREAGKAFELINRAANASEPIEIDNLQAEAQRSIRAMDGLVSDFDPDISLALFEPLRGLRGAIIGNASLFASVRRAMAVTAESRRLIAENESLSVGLKTAVDKLVAVSRYNTDSANTEARRAQALGRDILFTVAALSLASSFLIVWLYVGRNIVARLTRLSGAMIEIASGARQTAVPASGSDEVAAMGRAVEVFQRNAIELDKLLAERAEAAQRLEQLVEERTADLQESLEYQTATSDVLKVISGSSFDIQPVFDTIVATAARLCDADGSGIAMREGEVYRYVAMHATYGIDEYYALMRYRTFGPGRDTTIGRVALEGEVVHITDIAADPEYTLPESSVVGGIRTNLGVPLLRDGLVVGMLTLFRQRVEPFTDRQIELVRTFADQAVIAIENARLLGELQARTDELTRSVAELQALEEVSRAVNSSLDLDTVLATIVSRAAQLSQADEGTIYEFDDAEEAFVPKSAFGMSEERVEALRERKVRMGETHLGRAAVERAPVHVDDVQQDPTLSGPDRGALLEGIHAVLAVPLLREDKVVGGLVIRRRTAGGFAPTIPTLLQTFAGQAVLAIENARLFQELGRRGEEARRARTAAEAALADLRRAQDRLIQAEKMASLGQLTAGIAHEIKNPLNFVNNFAGLSVELLDELKETAAPAIAGLAEDERADVDEIVGMLTGNLEKIAEHGRRADGIVKSMLEHSRGESGERREVDLNNLVEEALNLAYHGARAQDQKFNITLERDFAQGIAPIELVPQDITRVCLNLFGNGFYAATKREREGGGPEFRPMLRVMTKDLGDTVEIRVRDNGTGIPPEIRDKLFQPFFTTKPTGERTGLGLSISWDIVTQQHGGTIAVDSRVGEFTEFAIRLPRAGQATTIETAA
jgi:two-component system, NtrC family, sensor kinase